MKKSGLNQVAILFAKIIQKNVLILIATGMFFTLISCGPIDQNTQKQNSDITSAIETETDANVFVNKEMGWTIEIPEDWTNEDIYEEDNTSDAKALLLVFKSKNNMFIAAAGNIGVENDEAFEKSHLKNIETHFYGFKKRGFTIDNLTNSVDTIGGQYFIVYECILNNADGSYAMNQKICASYINGFDFMVTLIYNNDIDKATLIKMMDSSKFKIKNQ